MDRHSPRSVLLMLSAVIVLGLSQTPLAASVDEAPLGFSGPSEPDQFIQCGYEIAGSGLSATQIATKDSGAEISANVAS